jgi:hypothetical protein
VFGLCSIRGSVFIVLGSSEPSRPPIWQETRFAPLCSNFRADMLSSVNSVTNTSTANRRKFRELFPAARIFLATVSAKQARSTSERNQSQAVASARRAGVPRALLPRSVNPFQRRGIARKTAKNFAQLRTPRPFQRTKGKYLYGGAFHAPFRQLVKAVSPLTAPLGWELTASLRVGGGRPRQRRAQPRQRQGR